MPKRKCEGCGTTEGVTKVIEPYTQEISGIRVWVWYSNNCYNTAVSDT